MKPKNVRKDENVVKTQFSPEFSKSQLSKSERLKKYGLHRDILCAILKKDKYTIEEAEKEIKDYINSFK